MDGSRDAVSEQLAHQPGWPGWPPVDPGFLDGTTSTRARPLEPDDLTVPWQLDFHHPRGVLPLGVGLLDTMTLASAQAARRFGLGGGFIARMVGPHVYFGPVRPGRMVPATPWRSDPAVISRLDEFAERFRPGWAADSRRLALALGRLESVRDVEVAGAGAAAVREYLDRARAVHRDAWQVHFDTMYPLLGILKRYVASCAELGIGTADAIRVLEGERTSVTRVDEGLRALVALARDLGLSTLPEGSTGPEAIPEGDRSRRVWREAWEEFLIEHGHRGQGGADVATPGWLEDPGPVRELIIRGLSEPPHRPAAPRDPEELVARVGAELTPAARGRFESLVRAVRRVNFAWWSEDHNVLIDLRAHLPVRTAGMAAGVFLHPEDPELALYLHGEELSQVLSGGRGWTELVPLAEERRRYVRSWQDRRRTLPTTIGTVRPVEDLVLQEVFGAAGGGNGAGRATAPAQDAVDGAPVSPESCLPGLSVSAGTARGPARVIPDVTELFRVRPGEVLVCEATSPAWTPVFDRIVGCVCDQGGMLTHAAIIAREFGVPAVCAVPAATGRIRDGDLVEVDAVAGQVRIWRELPGPGPESPAGATDTAG
jgi:pyruvate,water dikinase